MQVSKLFTQSQTAGQKTTDNKDSKIKIKTKNRHKKRQQTQQQHTRPALIKKLQHCKRKLNDLLCYTFMAH